MQLDHPAASRLLMQAIGVLGDHRPQVAELLQLDQRAVCRIGLGIAAAVVEAVRPVLGRILSEGVDVGHLVGIELGPESAFAAKVRDAAFHRDARAGEGDGGARPPQERGGIGDCSTGG